MGTTLAHGIYLPNEGERNCYAGLKVNWETLDQKVADISALQSAIAGALHREIVASLPTTDIDTATIYMILNGTSATENIYDEYMYISNAWELIGTSATDLTNYYTKGEVDSKLLLKASASDLTSHTGNTTIHVTASDKQKWDTLALIKHLRLVNAQVGSATTIAFSDIDDTNGIKVGDKCMDLDAKLFEISAVDTANQTVTVTPLLDIALDANVVHTSGAETINGAKTFNDKLTILSAVRGADLTSQTVDADTLTSNASGDIKLYRCTSISGAVNITNIPVQTAFLLIVMQIKYTGVADSRTFQIFYDVASSSVVNVYTRIQYNGTWSNWQKDTDKFVTTEGNQTVSGQKIFTDNFYAYNPDTSGTTPKLSVKTALFEKGDTANTDSLYLQFLDKLSNYIAGVTAVKNTAGSQYLQFSIRTTDADNNNISSTINYYLAKNGERAFTPYEDNLINLGTTQRKWKNTCTNLVNSVVPSALSLPVTPSTTSYVDISGYITVLDGSAPNTYTPPSNGYITFSVTGNLVQIFHDYGLQGKWSVQAGSANRGFIPVLGGVEIKMYVSASSIDKFWFIPCQGNV